MFSRILTFSGWPGWLNANGYKYAMLYLDANIMDACYSSKATLHLGNKKSILKKSAKWSLLLDPVTYCMIAWLAVVLRINSTRNAVITLGFVL